MNDEKPWRRNFSGDRAAVKRWKQGREGLYRVIRVSCHH